MIVLKRKSLVAPKRERRIATAIVLVFTAVFVALFYPVFDRGNWTKGAEELLIQLAGALLIALAIFWYTARAKKLERLYLDERGIRYQSPLPEWLASLQPSWSHSWAQIACARIVIPKLAFNPDMAALVIDAVTVQRRLAGLWVAADSPEDSGTTGSLLFRSHQVIAEQIARDMEQSPAVQYLRRAGVKVETREVRRAGFALERNRASLGALVLTFALIAYAGVDWMVNSETYAVKPPAVLFVLAGALVVLAGVLVLAWNEVPHAEAWGVSIVLGAAFAAALYPGLLRVNQLTDGEGLKPQLYRLEDHVVFKPLDSRLPDLVFLHDHEYWQQFPRGSEHEFLMRKGALGFQQIDMAPVHARMREFYQR